MSSITLSNFTMICSRNSERKFGVQSTQRVELHLKKYRDWENNFRHSDLDFKLDAGSDLTRISSWLDRACRDLSIDRGLHIEEDV